ncbi:hypothetical protein DFH11DRAFT_992332 [Phellopilus nigrolimitatus]|nr:hypothetical protein DFH11DRAFT_992332 [Phellopilus nigrolimitatus]
MDRSNFNVMSLFARAVTPPQDSSSPTHPSQQLHQHPHQHVSPAQSYREPPPASPPKSLDSLFRNLNNTQPSAASEPGPTPPAVANMNNPFRTQVPPPNTNNSAPATPVSSITAASHSSAGSAQNQPPADRQSALLSLLGSTVAPSGASSSATSAGNQPLIPHQPPSPPSIEQREQRVRLMQSGNEAQGKILLEQLMSG